MVIVMDFHDKIVSKSHKLRKMEKLMRLPNLGHQVTWRFKHALTTIQL